MLYTGILCGKSWKKQNGEVLTDFPTLMMKHGALRAPRICRVLSHRDEGTSYSLQWEVDDSVVLHRWHQDQGARLNQELVKIFKDKVVGFPTLMEVLE